ncbi:thioredoxin-like protein [Schizophyllum commune]
MSITHITSLSQLNGILDKSKDKLSVIDFHASWCGPCHAIAPVFEALSKQYKDVNFLKCDVDAAREVSGHHGISAMPTFIFLKGHTKVHQVRGANKAALEAGIRQYSSGAGASGGAFAGQGRTLGGDSPAASGSSDPLSPQLKIFLYLIAAYGLFWYLS